MFLQTALASLILASTADGFFTNRAIRNGAHEADKIMVWIFGTDRPGCRTIFLRGAAVISCESLAAVLISHFHPHAAVFFAAAFFIQASVHVYEAFRGLTFKPAN